MNNASSTSTINHTVRHWAFITPLLVSLACATLWLPSTSQAAATQGSGQQRAETRSVGDFQAVSMAGSMDLVVRQGAQPSLQVQADDNLLPLLETVVENGAHGATLHVRWKSGSNVTTRTKVLVTAVVPRLTRLAAAGSGDIRVDGFNTPAFELVLSGAGDVKLNGLTTDTLGVRISGSGDVAGSGKAGRLAISIAGSGS